KTLIVYFSWSGCVGKLAERLRIMIEPSGEVAQARIEPTRKHGYWGWLLRSFLPGWKVAIRPVDFQPAEFDLVCLGFPKWTLGCPPVNQFIAMMRLAPAQRVALFMSYGGFDGERYLRTMSRKVADRGAKIAATACIRRSSIYDGSFEETMSSFASTALSGR
ncbi:MAG TPA: hypothetical protein VE398_15470, partial [Acidobacteriota bacterium]|nr:hypothetical protein [Acidobacteriota bacterium]